MADTSPLQPPPQPARAVNDDEKHATDDPWLTLAEIAQELRVGPATVRLWISRGRLKAMRPGQRKLLVRRSELQRMLDGSDPPQQSPTPAWNSATPIPRIALSREEAAVALGMSLNCFERHVEPELQLIRRGQLQLVPVAELERWAIENAGA